MIFISCRFEMPIFRSDYTDYVRPLQLDVLGCDEDGNTILLGMVAADRVLISEAQDDEMSLFEACEADSQGLTDAYMALFDNDGEFQPELNIDEQTVSLIFVSRVVFHPRLRPYLTGVIAAIGSLFGNSTVVAFWQSTTELTDAELAFLGFRRIAGSSLIYCHSEFRSGFRDEHPMGMDVPVEFTANESDAKWVLAEWAKDRGSPFRP